MQLVDFKSNWRLYATVMVALGLGVADRLQVTVPSFVMWLLGWIGNVPLREAIRAQSKESADDIIKLVEDILAQVSVPGQPSVNPQSGLTGDLPKPLTVIEVKDLPPVKP